MSAPSFDSTQWIVARTGCDPAENAFYEGLFGLTNGRFGVRATVDFDGAGKPGCFHFDVYGPAVTTPSHIVNVLNPTFRAFTVGGLPVSLVDAVEFTQWLDLRTATLELRALLRDGRDRLTSVEITTFLPATSHDLVATRIAIETIDHDGDVVVTTGVDWQPGNGDFGGTHERVRLHPLDATVREYSPGRLLVVAGNVGADEPQVVTVAATITAPTCADRGVHTAARRHGEAVRLAGGVGRRHVVDQVARLTTDPTAAQPTAGFDELLAAHEREWAGRWAGAAEVAGPAEAVEALRYAQFQLLQSVDRDRHVTNQPARGLTSEYHSGHMFFNSEFFMLPCLAFTEPDVARAMLRFRITTLDAAIAHAAETGYAGARYPEEVDRRGRPASPFTITDVFGGVTYTEWSGKQVKHLSADVLHALAVYVQATGDEAFLRGEALPMVEQAATYLADLMRVDERVGGRGACEVMGFDEYHYGVDHSYGTNVLAKWALGWAADLLDRPEWRKIADEVHLPSPVDGVVPVFEGYFDLPDQLRSNAEGHRLPVLDEEDAERAELLQSFQTRLVKQADVVFAMTLVSDVDPGLVDDATIATNLAFYEPRTVHESSLSMTPHGVAAARVGDVELATELFLASARYNLDFTDRRHYANGVHLAAYAGAWLVLFRGFLGARVEGDALAVTPRLPAGVTRLRMPVRFRGATVTVTVDERTTTVSAQHGPATIVIAGQRRTLRPGEEWSA